MDTNELERMGRRRFVKSLGMVGVSSSTLQHLGQEELTDVTDDPEKEIPFVEAYEVVERRPGEPPRREPIYDTIPREEWERRRAALDVRDRMCERLDRLFPDQPVTASFTGKDGSPTGFGVDIDVVRDDRLDYSLAEIEAALPTEATGRTPEDDPVSLGDIPIDVTETTDEPCCTYVDKDYDSIPGGQKIATAAGGGTLMGTFHSGTYGDGWVTAGHVAGESGNDVYQQTPNGQVLFGRAQTTTVTDHVDCAFVKPVSDETPTDAISEPNNDGIDVPISGFVTDEAMENYVDDTDYTLYRQGRTSCRNSGHINEAVGHGTKAVVASMAVSDGDSGGPMFRLDADGSDALIAADVVSKAGVAGYDTKGTTVETIENELGGYVY